MYTEISMEQLYDLFYEVRSSCQFLTKIIDKMKKPRILLSITDEELITTVTVMDCENPANTYLFNLNMKKYMKSGYFELKDIPSEYNYDPRTEEEFEDYVLSHSPETVTPFAPIEEDELPF